MNLSVLLIASNCKNYSILFKITLFLIDLWVKTHVTRVKMRDTSAGSVVFQAIILN